MAVIDFHCHILPGIDDGSRNTDMSVEMLRQEHAQGVDIVVATPHFYPDMDNMSRFLEKRAEAGERLAARELEDVPRILFGAEVAYFPGIGKANGIDENLCIEGTRTLLLEMPFEQWNPQAVRDVETICGRGTAVVLAHLERFMPLQKDLNVMREILDLPVFVQINAEYLLSRKTRRRAADMFQDHSAHLLGSDAHNLTDRAPNLGQAREVLKKRLGQSALRRIDRYGEALLSR